MGWETVFTVFRPLVAIDDVIWNGTFAIFALFFAATWGYHLSKAYEVNGITGSLISVASFVMSIANIANVKLDHSLPQASQSLLSSAKIILRGDDVHP